MNNGSLLKGAGFSPGFVGKSFSFDGIDDSVAIPESPTLTYSNSEMFTLELWFKPGSETPAFFILKQAGYGFRWQGSSAPLAFYNGNPHNSTRTTWPLGQWYHVVLVDDGYGAVKLYVNGLLDKAEYGTARNPNRSAGYPLALGGDSTGHFQGELDDISIYDRDLADYEIQGLFAAGASGKCVLNPPWQAVYVDDDAPGDPGPADPNLSDPLEDGSVNHPFDRINEALALVLDNLDLFIAPGSYLEDLSLPPTCRITGEDKSSTIIQSSSGTLLTYFGYSAQLPYLRIRGITLENGSVGISHGNRVSIEDTNLVNVNFDSLGTPDLHLTSVSAIDGSIFISGSYDFTSLHSEDLTLSNTQFSLGSWAFAGAHLRRLSAPDTIITAIVSGGGEEVLSISDSTVGSISVTYGNSRLLVKADNTHFTEGGIEFGTREGIHELEVTNSTFDNGGIVASAASDMDATDIQTMRIIGNTFRRAGVALYRGIGVPTDPAVLADWSVDSCRFEGEGLSVSVNQRPNWYQAGKAILSVTNSVFLGTPIGVGVISTLSDEPLGPFVDELRSAIVNNTFLNATNGVRIAVSPHAPGGNPVMASIENNIIVGGGTGMEIDGTEDLDLMISSNDVFGNSVGKYVGDITDQTGLNGNISADPVLGDPDTGDLRLSPGSPCIDAGQSGQEVPNADFAGAPRPLDGNLDGIASTDIGAFEFVPDGDGDGRNVLGDCNDSNLYIWATPGEVRNLVFTDGDSLEWDAPLAPGGVFAFYDTVRSSVPVDFVNAAACVESSDALDSKAFDAAIPPEGEIFFYLVRAKNPCPMGTGPLGFRSDGSVIPGRSCP